MASSPRGARLATGNTVYRRVFDFWLKVFAVSFGMGVVTGIVPILGPGSCRRWRTQGRPRTPSVGCPWLAE
jgi:hypothetical protein